MSTCFFSQISKTDSLNQIISEEKNNIQKLKTINEWLQFKLQNNIPLKTTESDLIIGFIEKNKLDTSAWADSVMINIVIYYYNISSKYVECNRYLHKHLIWLQKKSAYSLSVHRLCEIAYNYIKMHLFDMAEKTLKDAEELLISKINKDDTIYKNLNLKIYDAYSFLYYETGNFDKCLQYGKIQLNIAKEINNTYYVVRALNTLALCYTESGKYNESLNLSLEILNIDKKRKSYNMDTMSYFSDISVDYYNIANLYVKIKDLNNAIKYIDSTLYYNTKSKTPDPEVLSESLYLLMEIYMLQGNIEKAFEYRTRFFEVKDSLYNLNLQSEIAKQNSIYQLEKKELEKQKLVAEKQRQKYIIIGTAISTILSIILIIVIFNGYKQKQKANIELERKNHVIELQKKMVETHNKNITDSIHYASRIQRALLATDQYLSSHFNNLIKDYFILYLPKDIVSGDFYWALQKENYFYFVVGDSTGHGVPGAFMSLLNISFLNEAITEKNITDTGKIFDYVKQQLIFHLRGEKDGMDATIIRFDLNNKMHIQYSAANHQPVIINQQKELIKCSYTKSPIGAYEFTDIHFESYDLILNNGDAFYLFTDGYADQFGGEKDKKFQKSNFYRILLQYYSLSANEQKEFLKKIFIEWKADREQTDDVCVAGIFF
ncbi:MAG: hypothetical protein Fur0023_14580 [Bacteroidia bacterium]